MDKFLQRYRNLLFYLLGLLVVFIPLYPKFPLIRFSKTFVAIRFEDFLISLVFIIWLIYLWVSKEWRSFIKDRIIQAIILFFLIGALSLISAFFITQLINVKLATLHYLRRVELMMLLPFAYSSLRSRSQLKSLVKIFGGVVILVTLYAFGQQYLHFPVISTTNSEFSKGQILYLTPDARVNSTFAGHYDLAIFLMMVICILAALFFSASKLMNKIWSGIVGGLAFVVLVMTAARLSFAAVVFGVVMALWLSGKKIFLLLLVILAVGAIAYPSQLRDRLRDTVTVNFLGGGSRYEATPEQRERNKLNLSTLPIGTSDGTPEANLTATVSANKKQSPDLGQGEPVDTTQLGVYRSFKIRTDIEWPKAITAFLKNPILGTGYSSLGLATDNDYLRSLGEVGLLGTLALGLIIWEVIFRIARNMKNNKYDRFLKYLCAGVLSMIFAFLINALVIDVFEASKVASLFWLILGITMAIEKFTKEETI